MPKIKFSKKSRTTEPGKRVSVEKKTLQRTKNKFNDKQGTLLSSLWVIKDSFEKIFLSQWIRSKRVPADNSDK